MRKYVAPELVFGEGASSLAGRYARNFGATRTLVVSDPGIVAAGWTDAVVESCRAEGLDTLTFYGVDSSPNLVAATSWHSAGGSRVPS